MAFLVFYIKILFLLLTACLTAQNYAVPKSVDAKFNQLKTTLNQAKQQNDSLLTAQVYVQLADFYKSLGLSHEAVNNYHLAESWHGVNDSLFVYINNQLGDIHLNFEKFLEAEVYLQSALGVSKSIAYQKGEAKAYALLGSVAEKQSNYNKALAYQETSLHLFKTLGDSTGLAIANENIGSIYEDLSQYAMAENYFLKALHHAKHSNPDVIINIINNLGDSYRKTKQFTSALSYTQQALSMARTSKNSSQEESALKDLAKTYAEMGDFKQAHHFLSRQSQINEQELKRHSAEIISSMQILHDVKAREAQLQLLNKQNQLSKVRQLAILLIALAISIIFICVLFYLKKKKTQERTILKYQQQLLQVDLERKTTEKQVLKREIDIQINALTNYSLSLAQKNKMLADVSRTLTHLKDRNSELIKSKLTALAKDINFSLSQQNEWTEFMQFFGQIHPNFFDKLKAEALDNLSASDLKLCMLIKLNLSSKEIASILNISPDSVRIARYRMRKKLPLDTNQKLHAYLQNIDYVSGVLTAS